MKIRNQGENEKNELNMTSMIDIVFLLLVFFVMTFKVVEMEGDFSVRMPLGDSQGAADPTDLGLKLRLRADSQGRLASMALNDSDLGTDYDALRARIVSQIGSATPTEEDEGPELEIDTDYNLRYENVIKAITAVSGYKDGNEVVKLIEKIKFAKPRR
ncbi:biopolymer transporter ExbD [Novipirellula caenicola]|uniref:Biopolymer transport protein ExbD/TolR n=1 Tax=Novipirellula caenicola TaxID=1536901 RepID=A0ABP9W4G1_9BACT